MMITVRYNFETNSSSMHSLAIRANGGAYDEESLKRVENIPIRKAHDALIVMDDNIDKDYVDKFYNYGPYDNAITYSGYDLDFRNSAMSVLCTFRDKLMYLVSLSLSNRKYRHFYEDIVAAVKQYYGQDVKLEGRRVREDSFGVNSSIVGKYMVDKNIAVYDFLSDPKYIVIVEVEEFFKMQWLNMVDMSRVVDFVCDTDDYENRQHMNIQNGVWFLSRGDLCFGRSPYRVLGTVEGKARYALAASTAEQREEIISIIKEVYPEITDIAFPLCSWSQEIDYGYVEDDCMPVGVSLRDFILDKKYVVISDGDEYCIWRDFKKTPLFNTGEYPAERVVDDD